MENLDLSKMKNDYPIVLVHGMCGWGRDEMLGKFLYWGGGAGDIQEYLIVKGYEVFTASMGPLSSNWDRACELYAYIKGGVVDYGAVHSSKYGHARFGRSYPGILPNWNEENKVHLLGHSMGGPTPRYLIHLLENGDPDEMAFVPSDKEAPISDLFKGGKKFVHSLTTVAGVHNGAISADDAEHFQHLIKDVFYKMAALSGMKTSEPIYDFNLQQW
jgi:triacylglycerol lipase